MKRIIPQLRYSWILVVLFVLTACPQSKDPNLNLIEGVFEVKVGFTNELSSLGVPRDVSGATSVHTALLRVFDNSGTELFFDASGNIDVSGSRQTLIPQPPGDHTGPISEVILILPSGDYTFQLLSYDDAPSTNPSAEKLAFIEVQKNISSDTTVRMDSNSLINSTSLDGPLTAQANQIVDVLFYTHPPGHPIGSSPAFYVPEDDYPMPTYQVLENGNDVTLQRVKNTSKIGVRLEMNCADVEVIAEFKNLAVRTDVAGTVPPAPTGGTPWTEQMGPVESASTNISLEEICTNSTTVESDQVPPFVSITAAGSNGNDINIQGETNDGQTGIKKVEIYEGIVLLGTAAITPVGGANDTWEFTWGNAPTAPAGGYDFTAIAYDNADSATRASTTGVAHSNTGGATASLLKDINPSGDSLPSHFTNINGTLFFAAGNSTIGLELWKSDGTAVGTALVKNINPSGDSFPIDFTNVNGTLFFSAGDGTNGAELWKSDGTTAGTILVKDIRPGRAGSSLIGLTNVNGTLFFRANDGINGSELWKSDGTVTGTVMVKNINPSGGSWNRSFELININGTLFFVADDGTNGAELWKSDGTAIGTVMVKDINPGSADSLNGTSELININGTLFFRADDGTNGNELWKSDGTAAGTVLVKDINPSNNSNLLETTSVNGTLFFRANDGTNGLELWKSDGTAVGTVLVKDIDPSGSSFPYNLTDVNGTLFFNANDGTNGRELWKSDGTTAGTVMVQNINPSGDSLLSDLANVNGTLFFNANDGTNGHELWKSDGTTTGTVLVQKINPSGSSFPSGLTNVNGTLFFSADDGTNGRELWIYK